jgi:hypothetical protein
MKTYRIPAQNVESLKGKIADLQKRQAKIAKKGQLQDVDPITLVVGEKIWVTAPDQINESLPGAKRAYYLCTITGKAPKLAGWEFIATLQHEEAGTILRTVPTVEIQESELDPYRTAPPACDHCKAKRRRNDTFIVRQDVTGIVKQVGSSCLADFLGTLNPHHIAALAELIALAGSVADEYEGWGIGSGPAVFDLPAFLAFASRAIRADGWVSRTAARATGAQATADTAWGAMTCPDTLKVKKEGLYPEATDVQLAQAALEWAEVRLNDADQGLSDYEHNLQVVVNGNIATQRLAGLAASILSYYEREQGKALEVAQAQALGHFGTIGEKVTWTFNLVGVFSAQTQYGTLNIHRFQTLEGQVAVWKTTSIRLDPGTYTVTGAIKAHDIYKGIPQTVLTRCKATKAA